MKAHVPQQPDMARYAKGVVQRGLIRAVAPRSGTNGRDVLPLHLPRVRVRKGAVNHLGDQVGALTENFNSGEFVVRHLVGCFDQDEGPATRAGRLKVVKALS